MEGGLDVNIQDQISTIMIVKMSNLIAETTLKVLGIKDTNSITVTSATGMIVGQYLTIYCAEDNRVFFGTITAIDSLVITLDTPLDFAYPASCSVTTGNTNLAVDGSSTTKIFGVRNTTESIPLSIDITKIKITCITTSAVDLSLFGDITALAKGIILRTVDGVSRNIFNIKTNQELSNIMTFTPYAALNPAQGVDGFSAEFKIAGQSETGVVIRLDSGDDLQMIIQDNLSDLTSLYVWVIGHVVVD